MSAAGIPFHDMMAVWTPSPLRVTSISASTQFAGAETVAHASPVDEMSEHASAAVNDEESSTTSHEPARPRLVRMNGRNPSPPASIWVSRLVKVPGTRVAVLVIDLFVNVRVIYILLVCVFIKMCSASNELAKCILGNIFHVIQKI